MNAKTLVYLTVLAAAFACSAQQVVKTKFPTWDVVIAEEVLTPPAVLGTALDFAVTLQEAIDRVAKKGGGTVFLTAGEYAIHSRVTVREGVTVRGDHSAKDVAGGTILRLSADRGDENAPATFSIERGSGLVGLAFWYPEQRMSDPMPYPWTVKNAQMSANDNQTVADCTFVNAWKAICIGPDGNELHTFRNVSICALKTGISIDSTTDIGRISEVTVSPDVWAKSGLPGAPDGAALANWLRANDTVGVDIGRSDWEYIWRLTVNGYKRGLVLRKGARGTTNAVMLESQISGCGTALEVDVLNQVGFSAYRCTFAGAERALDCTERFDSVVQFYACAFTGGAVENRGTGVMTFQACDLTAGRLASERGLLTALACRLGEVRLGRDVVRVRLLGFDGKRARVENNAAGGDVVIDARALPSVADDRPVRWLPTAKPRPKADALFAVSEFGASPEKEDNAAAFQAALDLAAAKGGGTVYVPAGLYTFRHDITVPTGVELRGCSDVPHHTVSKGAVLMAVHGKGNEEGTPFVSLKPGAGLRGLTFWYPEQPLKKPVPYPWTVRSLGKNCWLVDVTIGNAWQGVDFATHPSDGHYISYLAGSMYRRGLFVGNSRGNGWVEDVQFNPHYAARLPQGLPRVNGDVPGDAGGHIIQFQREHLEGLVFRDCRREFLRGTFLYAAHDGIAFHGKVNADVLMHGTDTGSRGAYFKTEAGSTVRLALAQLVAKGDWVEAAVVTAPENRGVAEFLNTQVWSGPRTGKLHGGTVRLEQFNTLSGLIEAHGGELHVLNGVFDRSMPAHVSFGAAAKGSVVGTIFEQGMLRVEAENAGKVKTFGNSFSVRSALSGAANLPTALASGFEQGEPEAARDTVATTGGGIRRVSGNRCGAVERDDAHGGKRAVLLTGNADDHAYSFVYQTMFEQPVLVIPDTVLTYWFKPLNENGRSSGIDLRFADGKVLRSTETADTDGVHTFPGIKRGRVGEWTKITVPLGNFAGNTITTVMAAYDTRRLEGHFESLFDDVSIASELQPAAWQVRAEPAAGCVPRGTSVTLAKDASVQVRYTLDGTAPTAASPLYEQPITLPKKGRVDLRYMPLTAAGLPSKQMFGALYEVE